MAAGASPRPGAASEWSLPPAVSQEILRCYGDILRVGRLTLNGREVAWNTCTSNEGQLESFCARLVPSLMETAPELARQEPDAIRFVPYWLCKAVSINYALIEVVLMVQRRVGVLCTIETREDYGSGLVEYHVELRPGNLMCVSLSWRKADNIIHCDPLTAKREVKGTISCLETCFQVPPGEGFAPAYSFQLRLKRSLTQILARSLTSTIVCGGPDRKVRATETICIDEPLRSDFPLESYAELAERAAKDARPAGEPCNDSPGSRWPTLDWVSELSDGVEVAVGCLHVRLAGAAGLERPTHRWPDGSTTSASDPETKVYATLTVAGQTKQTRHVPMCANPEWDETVLFPLRAQDLRQEVVARLFLYHPRKGLRFWGRGSVPISTTLSTSALALPGAALYREADAVNRRRQPHSDEEGPSDDDLGVFNVRLDGHGGKVLCELELVPQAATPLPPPPSPPPPSAMSAGRRISAAAAAAAAAVASAALKRSDVGKGTLAVSASSETGRGPACDDEECIVEVGRSAMWSRFRGLEFIQVRAASGAGPAAQGGSMWCSRPCTL